MTDPNRITVEDRGWDRLVRALTERQRMSLVVGIQGDEAKAVHPRTKLPVGDYAAINEWGEGVPTRSMIRTWVDENKPALIEDLADAYRDAIKHGLTPTAEESSLQKTGDKFVLQVQARIQTRDIPPPNAQMTVERKGFDHPLFETGLLIGSFTAKVQK